MEGLKARLLPPELAGFVGPEDRKTEVVVGAGGQVGGYLVCAVPRPAHPVPGRYAGGIALEADHHRASIGQLIAKHCLQEFTVADDVGFVGFVGLRGVRWKNCLARARRLASVCRSLAGRFQLQQRAAPLDLRGRVTRSSPSSRGILADAAVDATSEGRLPGRPSVCEGRIISGPPADALDLLEWDAASVEEVNPAQLALRHRVIDRWSARNPAYRPPSPAYQNRVFGDLHSRVPPVERARVRSAGKRRLRERAAE